MRTRFVLLLALTLTLPFILGSSQASQKMSSAPRVSLASASLSGPACTTPGSKCNNAVKSRLARLGSVSTQDVDPRCGTACSCCESFGTETCCGFCLGSKCDPSQN
jgi:hypothetical protein